MHRPAHPRALFLRAAGFALATIIAAATSAFAQASYESPAGTVEVLGLRRWTLAMLRDSIRRYAPGQDLHDAACIMTLRDSLHFAEASVTHWPGLYPGAPERSFLAIKVVEPQDNARVKWDTRERDEFSGLLPDYAGVTLPITDTSASVHLGRFTLWFQIYTLDSVAQRNALSRVARINALSRAQEGGAADADAHRVWTFLDQHQADADRQRALRLLRDDGFWVNRYVAAAVLVNFGAQDSTWYALVRALRDPHADVRESAAASLRQLPARKVAWKPVAADLRLLLGGTNLSGIETVFQLLDRTEVSPALASTLLRGNADLVLDHLASRAPQASTRAHNLLVRLNNGVDLGATRAAWKKWAAGL